MSGHQSFLPRVAALALIIWTCLASSVSATTSDRPQWRGQNRSNVSSDAGLLNARPQGHFVCLGRSEPAAPHALTIAFGMHRRAGNRDYPAPDARPGGISDSINLEPEALRPRRSQCLAQPDTACETFGR
jgi:hypothetical protein